MNEIYRRTNDDLEVIMDPNEPSQIHKFYIGKTIFFTGCTGFIGKLVVEKLLRTCPEIKKIYVLIRTKANKTIDDRLDEYFQNVIFGSLREKNPDFRDKVVPLNGNLSDPGLGLSPADRRKIIEEADIIIHNGASVLFNLRISQSLKLNVLGTKEMLDLATECERLQVFVYVSTAYSHCYMKYIKEEFYDPPADMKMVQEIIAADTRNASGLTEDAIRMILGKWPNIYTFTKATAEGIVEQYSKRVPFPCCIFRPSSVTSTWHEPVRGWFGNMNGLPMAAVPLGLGELHTIYCLGEPMDYVPADMTTNAVLAVTWDAIENRKDVQGVRIYNYGSSTIYPRSVSSVCHLVLQKIFEYPSIRARWYYYFIPTRNYAVFWIFHILFHFIPAIVMDARMILLRKKPKFLSLFNKLQRNLDLLAYFYNGGWRFDVTEMTKVWDKMNEQDHVLFFNDIRKWDTVDYFSNSWIGIREYLLNEPPDTVDAARRRYEKLKILHYATATLLLCIIVYSSIRVVNFFFAMVF